MDGGKSMEEHAFEKPNYVTSKTYPMTGEVQ